MNAKRLHWSALLLGFAFGGFFDGILLHQILQWHHLLSGLRGGVFGDLRTQVLADGLFHALMYVVAATGTWLAVRAGDAWTLPRAGVRFAAAFLLGFGAWHVADALLSHWITGIHRIRMDAANPLAWDVLWLAVFGLLPLAIGLRMHRAPHGGGPGGTSATLPVALLAVTLAAGAMAARPVAGGDGTVTVVMRPGADPGRLLVALSSSDARIVWLDPAATVIVLRADPALRAATLYRAGALHVSGSVLPAGCAAWLRAPGARA